MESGYYSKMCFLLDDADWEKFNKWAEERGELSDEAMHWLIQVNCI